jgi:general secretion pathway protein C
VVSGAVPPAVVTAPQTLAAEISHWRLFGQALQPMPQTATAVQPSSLGLQLEGIIAGSQPPLVMLRVGGEVRLLQVGDKVTSQVTVSAIEPDRVLISNQGRLEAIAFPKPASLNQAQPSSASLAVSGGSPAVAKATTGARVDAAEVMQNPQSLMRFVTVAPLQENGALTGYALRPVPGQEAFMQQLGLEPGDVLTSVDGMPVTDPALLPRVMPLLGSGQPLNVMIERGGQPMSVTINLDSLR